MNGPEHNLLPPTSNLEEEAPHRQIPTPKKPDLGAWGSLGFHWPEYLMEAGLLGVFMVSACVFGALYEFPLSPVHQAITSGFQRRSLMGMSMGLTAIAIVYSPWGKQSGAHINPSVTFTFFRLGKIEGLGHTLLYSGTVYRCSAGRSPGGILPRKRACRPGSSLCRHCSRTQWSVGSVVI